MRVMKIGSVYVVSNGKLSDGVVRSSMTNWRIHECMQQVCNTSITKYLINQCAVGIFSPFSARFWFWAEVGAANSWGGGGAWLFASLDIFVGTRSSGSITTYMKRIRVNPLRMRINNITRITRTGSVNGYGQPTVTSPNHNHHNDKFRQRTKCSWKGVVLRRYSQAQSDSTECGYQFKY